MRAVPTDAVYSRESRERNAAIESLFRSDERLLKSSNLLPVLAPKYIAYVTIRV